MASINAHNDNEPLLPIDASLPSPSAECDNHSPPARGWLSKDVSGDLNIERLKDQLGKMLNNHGDIIALFRSVSVQLCAARNAEDDLVGEWDVLRRRYVTVFEDSQCSASKCAAYLDSFKDVLLPSAMLAPTFELSQLEDFTNAIETHETEAKDLKSKFQSIAYDLCIFRGKIILRVAQAAPSAWAKFWKDVEKFCINMWQTICRLLELIGKAVQSLVSGVHRVKLDCFAFRLELEMRSFSPFTSDIGPSLREVAARIGPDSSVLVEKLRGFEGIWHLVFIACSDLRTYLQQARNLAELDRVEILGKASDKFSPLAQCLREFAAGQDTTRWESWSWSASDISGSCNTSGWAKNGEWGSNGESDWHLDD
ncbi:hypothetical protein CERSUDRAFT_117860 [Gelatoporia subvermispora B]|uniref:Uncharacterized protein n=1 Tax=Ceriporiopsis subvermispora (strain B) TaxID=914234 RepID=M2R4C6_CERS8|nr:hypothetical protein CERSUDRAFT_117860 [Gelatoporia subvermispora B]